MRGPAGKLRSETDRVGERAYSRAFYSNGSFATYWAWDEHGFVAGSSRDLSSTTQTSFSNGRGELTLWKGDQRSEHIWVDGGRPYLVRKFIGARVAKTTLYGPNDDSWTGIDRAESLFLSSRHEAWTLHPDGTASAQILSSYVDGTTGNVVPIAVPDEVIKQHIHQSEGGKRGPFDYLREQERELARQLLQDYATRRSEFMGAYRAELLRAGRTPESVGLRLDSAMFAPIAPAP